jgi:class 3 adenylate cyclase
MERKLTAILCADVHGYSRLMGEDEEATLRTLSANRKLIDSLIENHHGRFVNSAGDSVLAEFASVVEAVTCAVAIQTALRAENAQLPLHRGMLFRIGVNLGDVMVEGEQICGERIGGRFGTNGAKIFKLTLNMPETSRKRLLLLKMPTAMRCAS